MHYESTLSKSRSLSRFNISVTFDGDRIPVTIKTIGVNCYAVWMNNQYKFSVAAGLDEFDLMHWYVIEKNKYVPYVDQIGKQIESYMS